MGESLGPVLAKAIVTECEKVNVGKFIEDSIIKLYVSYVDDTLLIITKAYISCVLNKFYSFDDKLCIALP